MWDETVLLIKERGYDVQLHLHSQWINATYKDGHFYLSDNWNIGRCNPAEQQELILKSVQYLNSLMRQKFPEYKVCAFKAGSWGLQPSKNLIAEFERIGIHLILGVRDGLKVSSQGLIIQVLKRSAFPIILIQKT